MKTDGTINIDAFWKNVVAFLKTAIPPELLLTNREGTAKNKQETNFALGFINGRAQTEGRDWVEKLPNATWTTEQIVTFCRLMIFDERSWKCVAGFGPEIEASYWKQTGEWGPTLTASQYEFAMRKLVIAKRTGTAAQLLGAVLYHEKDFSAEFLLDMLDAIAHAAKEELIGVDAHHIGKIFECLHEKWDADQKRLAQTEFAFLSVLDEHTCRPLALERTLFPDVKLGYWSCL